MDTKLGNMLKIIWIQAKKCGVTHPNVAPLFFIFFISIIFYVLMMVYFTELDPIMKLILLVPLSLLVFIAERVRSLPFFIETLSQKIEFESAFEVFIAKNSGKNSVSGILATHLKDDLFKRLSVGNGQLEANNKWAAIEVYELFWKNLEAIVKELPKEGDHCLNCYAINSSAPEVWLGMDGKIFLDIQGNFCSKGHKIHRILCYPYTLDKAPEKVQQMAINMIKAKVSVYFYDTSEYHGIDHPYKKWDFLVMEDDKNGISNRIEPSCIVWTAEDEESRTSSPGTPSKATCFSGIKYFLEGREIDLKRRWNDIREHAKELELDDKDNIMVKAD
jgi:hypothetical protein